MPWQWLLVVGSGLVHTNDTRPKAREQLADDLEGVLVTELTVVLEWDKGARAYRWVKGYGMPMGYTEAEHAAADLCAAGGHFIPVPIKRLDGKRVLEPL
jgi:hypothetical protein